MLAQGIGSFVLWILYGVYQARRSSAIRNRVGMVPRSTRGLAGAGLMLLGILVLFGAFVGIQAIGGFTRTGMTPLAWVLMTLAGLLFVHCQTMGMAMLVSVALEGATSVHANTSSKPDTQEVSKT